MHSLNSLRAKIQRNIERGQVIRIPIEYRNRKIENKMLLEKQLEVKIRLVSLYFYALAECTGYLLVWQLQLEHSSSCGTVQVLVFGSFWLLLLPASISFSQRELQLTHTQKRLLIKVFIVADR